MLVEILLNYSSSRDIQSEEICNEKTEKRIKWQTDEGKGDREKKHHNFK